MTISITAAIFTNLVFAGIGILLGVLITYLHEYNNKD